MSSSPPTSPDPWLEHPRPGAKDEEPRGLQTTGFKLDSFGRHFFGEGGKTCQSRAAKQSSCPDNALCERASIRSTSESPALAGFFFSVAGGATPSRL